MITEPTEIYDTCVDCGQPTPYPKDLEIIHRYCYIEGNGQFCVDCWKKLEDEKNKTK